MKIGILTFHNAFNCGAMLQAWALQEVLRRNGCVACFPDNNTVGLELDVRFRGLSLFQKIKKLLTLLRFVVCGEAYKVSRAVAFLRFRNSFLNVVDGNATNECDLIVVGSDQVWNPYCAGAFLSIFLGESIPKHVPMVGYAISAGDKELANECRQRILEAAKVRFDSIAVREGALSDLLGMHSIVVCDPTLLLERKDYKLIECPRRMSSRDYLLVYAIKNAEKVIDIAVKVSKILNVHVVVLNAYQMRDSVLNDCCFISSASPSEMISYIRDAKYVIVSSFHGCVFSIIYEKPFVQLYEPVPYVDLVKTRQYALLDEMSLLSRGCPLDAPLEEIVRILKASFSCDKEEIDRIRRFSLDFINEKVLKRR